MYDNCDKGFDTLGKFKRHITEDHQEAPRQPSINDCINSENNADDEATDNESIVEKSKSVSVNDEDDEDDDLSKKELDAAEQNALNGLLKLCQFSSPKPSMPSPKEMLSAGSSKLMMINNIPVVPLLSPTSKSPKCRKYPTARPVCMKHNESSAKFYKKPKTSITNVSVQAISPKLSPQLEAQLKSQMEQQRNNGSNKKNNRERVSGRKRKLSDMNCNDLAHLTLKLQDKISDMDSNLQTTHKQLMMVRQLYRKKAKLNRNRR